MLRFSLVSFKLGIYQIPLQSALNVPVDFSKCWSRSLCYTTPFVLCWQVSLGACKKDFEGCLPLFWFLSCDQLRVPHWHQKVSNTYPKHSSIIGDIGSPAPLDV